MVSLWSQSGASAFVTLSGKGLNGQAFLKHSCLVESLTIQPLAEKTVINCFSSFYLKLSKQEKCKGCRDNDL
jgi:hypothetical protein